jgi:hypothetical protein
MDKKLQKLSKLSLLVLMISLCQFAYSQQQCDGDGGKTAYELKDYESAAGLLFDCENFIYSIPFAISVYNLKNSTPDYQKQAVKKLKSIPAVNTNYKEAQYYLGLFYKEGKGVVEPDDNAAREHFMLSGTDNAYLEIARLSNKLNNNKMAIEYYSKISESTVLGNKDKGEVNHKLGEYNESIRNIDIAIEYYRKAKGSNQDADKAYNRLLETPDSTKFVLTNTKGKPIYAKNVTIDKTNYRTNEKGELTFKFKRKDKEENKRIEIIVPGYKAETIQLDTYPIKLYPNNFWSKLTTPDTAQISITAKVGWALDKIAIKAKGREIEAGWGNRLNAEIDVNYGKKSMGFLGVGFHTNSYPFSKIDDKVFYENLSYKTAYVALGYKWRIHPLLYLNFQYNSAFNFGTSYKNYLLDYEIKDNKFTNIWTHEVLVGVSLMRKGWAGIELNYGYSSSVINKTYKMTINDIEFSQLYAGLESSGVHSLSLSLIISISVKK